MLNSYDIEQRALEKLGAFRREAGRARAPHMNAYVLRVQEAFRKPNPATSMTTPECVAATNLNAK